MTSPSTWYVVKLNVQNHRHFLIPFWKRLKYHLPISNDVMTSCCTFSFFLSQNNVLPAICYHIVDTESSIHYVRSKQMLPVFDIQISKLFFWHNNNSIDMNHIDIHIMFQAKMKDSSFYSTSFHIIHTVWKEKGVIESRTGDQGGGNSFSVISIPDRNFPLLLLKFFLKGWDSKQRCGKQCLSKLYCIRNNP